MRHRARDGPTRGIPSFIHSCVFSDQGNTSAGFHGTSCRTGTVATV
jgi:hypothetical protein